MNRFAAETLFHYVARFDKTPFPSMMFDCDSGVNVDRYESGYLVEVDSCSVDIDFELEHAVEHAFETIDIADLTDHMVP